MERVGHEGRALDEDDLRRAGGVDVDADAPTLQRKAERRVVPRRDEGQLSLGFVNVDRVLEGEDPRSDVVDRQVIPVLHAEGEDLVELRDRGERAGVEIAFFENDLEAVALNGHDEGMADLKSGHDWPPKVADTS